MKARFLALAALVLGLASCQKDFDAANVGAGGEVDFQLSVAAPELATRAGLDGVTPDGQADLNSAYGAIDYLQGGTAGDDLRRDWSDVNLRYTLEVYDVDENGNLVGEAPYAPVKDRQVIIVDEYQPVTFELRLVPKRHYRFVVFADFVPQTVTNTTQSTAIAVQEHLGISHVIGNTLADIKVKNDGINDERTDAYFGYENFTITNSASNDIVLKRPYGKLRVIATDLHELNLNVNPKKVKVEYTATHLTNFDAVTGAATLDKQNTEVEFDSTYNDVYKEADKGGLQNHFYTTGYDALEGHKYTNANGAVRHTHMTLFTDYILANNEVSPVHFTMTVYDRENKEIKSTTFNTDIPVQRNYLTTVIGNVLTTATEVEVRIDDNFSNGTEWNPEEDDFDIELVEVDSAKTLQEALDNYVNGQTILFVDDIEGNVTVDQVEGKDYVIDGNGFNYDGTIYIDGNARHTEAETLTIRNINFATDKDKINFIEQNSTDSAVRYPHNVTVENCSFRATGVDVAALKIRQGYNITIKDCVADGVTRANASGMHSLGQFYGCTGITIDGVNFNAGRGVSFGTSLNVVVKNSTFVAESYGLRADASVATTLTLENVNISADLPVVARKCTADYTINISGENTFDAPGYQIVFTEGDDATPFVTPTSNWKLNGGVGLRVFPGSNILYAYDAENLQYLLNKATGNTEIHLAADIVGDVTINQKENVNIIVDGDQHKFNGHVYIDGKNRSKGAETVKLCDINFETAFSGVDGDPFIKGLTAGNSYPHNITIDGCTFTNTVADNFEMAAASFQQFFKLKMLNCTATNMHSILQAQSCDNTVTIDNIKVINGKNGVSCGNTANVSIKNSEINTKEYGIRGDGDASRGNLVIENTKVNSTTPIFIRKVKTNGYAVSVDNASELTTTATYHIVFTKGTDDLTKLEAPTHSWSLTGSNGYVVYPRLVDTAEELADAFAVGGPIILEGDIDLTGTDWTPVGSADNMFSGNVDGNGHTIKGLRISAKYAGLIAYADENTTIKNLNLEDVDIQSDKNAAGVVCVAKKNVTIENVTISGNIEATSYAGGIVCFNNGSDDNVNIKNCENNATIKANRAAGIAAWIDSSASVFENVVNKGNITGGVGASGIVHAFFGTIKNATNEGNIKSEGSEPASGVAGVQKGASTYEYCYNYGNVTTTADNPNASAAGILGQTPGTAATIKYCANYGTITAEASYAAGIAYSLYGNVNASYCYNEGTVNGADGAGAIAPKAQYGSADKANYCLNAGTITSSIGNVYQGANNNVSCYYYNNDELLNVSDNATIAEADALAVLNGGADNSFFSTNGGKIVVIK